MTWNKDGVGQKFTLLKQLHIKKTHRNDGVKSVGKVQMINTNSMSTAMVTAMISGRDITEFLTHANSL